MAGGIKSSGLISIFCGFWLSTGTLSSVTRPGAVFPVNDDSVVVASLM